MAETPLQLDVVGEGFELGKVHAHLVLAVLHLVEREDAGLDRQAPDADGQVAGAAPAGGANGEYLDVGRPVDAMAFLTFSIRSKG